MLNLPMAVEALWDALAAGKEANAAIELIVAEYEVDSALLVRTFERRYDRPPHSISELSVVPSSPVRARQLTDFEQATNVALRMIPTGLPEWQKKAVGMSFNVPGTGWCIFAGFYPDVETIKFVCIETKMAYRWRGTAAVEIAARLQKRVKA